MNQQSLSEKPLGSDLLFSGFEEAGTREPEKTALVYLGARIKYGQLLRAVHSFSNALHDLGVGFQDRVMLYTPNCPAWVIGYLAIQRIGAVPVPVSPIYTTHEIRYMVQDAQVRTVICMDTNFGYVRELLAETLLDRVIVTSLGDLLPFWKKAVGAFFDKIPAGKVESRQGVYRFSALLRGYPPRTPRVSIHPLDHLAYILYTGGTTGFPKGVPGSHLGMQSYIQDLMGDVLRGHLRSGQDVFVCVAPLYHIMAQGFFLAVGLNSANTTVLMPVPQVDSVLKAIERHRARWFLGVPTLYRMILENDRLDRYDLSSLRYCFCGGDVLPKEVALRWEERFGIHLYQVYGSTEAGHVSYSRLGEPPRSMSLGYPLKSRVCRVVDPDTLEPVPPGEIGELLVSSPFTLKKYWNKPEETSRAFVPLGQEVYYRMGDYVTQAQDEELFFVERSADVIKCKGFRISASEVEAVLQDHPTVIAACVVGVPDPKLGERIKAMVVLKEDARGVGAADLIQWCRKHLASYKVPHYIEFRDMLPKSKVGKLLRREIREEERRKSGQARAS
jgi:long-chain acyl-CoA synthetase